MPIGNDQTISQPYTVALMTQELNLEKNHKVLELGTGSGYQCAILSLLARRIYTIERIKSLLTTAENNFKKLKLTNIVTKHGDGNLGWKEQIPFDRIIFTAATQTIPKTIFHHLKDEGVLIAPIINQSKQTLIKYTKKDNKIFKEEISEVLFVPNIEGIKN